MRKPITSLLLCFILLAAFAVFCTATSENAASSRINDAENALKDAFRTVWKTEGLKVNVSWSKA